MATPPLCRRARVAVTWREDCEASVGRKHVLRAGRVWIVSPHIPSHLHSPYSIGIGVAAGAAVSLDGDPISAHPSACNGHAYRSGRFCCCSFYIKEMGEHHRSSQRPPRPGGWWEGMTEHPILQSGSSHPMRVDHAASMRKLQPSNDFPL